MKLEGSLDAFSLSDIFQLLSFTKKSGGLHLERVGASGVVRFMDGCVTSASADQSRQALVRRLVGSGIVSDASLSSAVEEMLAGRATGLGPQLLEDPAVDAELIRAAATEQAVDAVFELLRWTQGSFSFAMGEDDAEDIGVRLPTEKVVAEAEARRTQWSRVTELIPSPDLVLIMPVVLAEDPQLTRDQWAMLAMIDGVRTVTDLVELTGCGEFAVASTLADLVDRGLLMPRDRRGDHILTVERRQALLAQVEGATTPDATETNSEPIPTPVGTLTAVSEAEPADELADESVSDPVEAAPEVIAVPEDVEGPATPAAKVGSAATPVAESNLLGGAHVPGDVVPPRPEPFLPKRQPDHPEPGQSRPRAVPSPAASVASGPATVGAVAIATDPQAGSIIERDPSVNRSLLLRLIAGVRGL